MLLYATWRASGSFILSLAIGVFPDALIFCLRDKQEVLPYHGKYYPLTSHQLGLARPFLSHPVPIEYGLVRMDKEVFPAPS